MKKLGLALGAGGARGVAHIGFLKALEDNGIKPSYISGSSMGSVIGACYAMGITPDYMIKAVTSLRSRDILDLSPNALKSGTLLKSKKMAGLLTRYFGNAEFDDLNIPFTCVGADIISGNKVVFSQGRVATAIQASSSIPLVFAPVAYENMLIADGSLVSRVPVEEVKKMGADVVVAVDVLGKLREYKPIKGLLSLLLKVVEVNDCHQTKQYYKKYKPNLLIEPELGDMSEFKVERLDFAYEQGYKAGLKYVKKIKKLLQD
jgi:NTE family protein